MNVCNSDNSNVELDPWSTIPKDEQIGQKRKRICLDGLSILMETDKKLSTEYRSSSSSSSSTTITTSLCTKATKDHHDHHEEDICHIDHIPRELFFKIISFIGPASSTLIVLTQINKRYANIMQQVGHSMLVRSKTCYKMHLPKIYVNESHMSLCTRHVRCFQDMMEKCNTLKNFLEKDFVYGCLMDALKRGWIDIAAMNEISAFITERDESRSNNHHDNNDNEPQANDILSSSPHKVPTTTNDIDQAMSIALDLLGKDNISYFLEHRNLPIEALHPSLSKDGRKNILEYFTSKMQRQILILCGKCGGKVFKYIKMISLLQQNRQNQMQLALDSVSTWKDEERLDRARLIMQLVMYRLMLIQKSDSVPVPTRDDFISSAEITQSDEDELSTSDLEEDGSSVKADEDKSVNEESFYNWLEGGK